MKILGIDPGYSILGWAVIEHSFKIVSYGTVETNDMPHLDDKLMKIHHAIKTIIDTYQPEAVSIEKLFFAKNTKTALDVAKCIGAVILSLKMANLSHTEYTPLQVKMSITGYGRASKIQIQNMMMKIFRIPELPKPDDAADAIAIATCHSLNINNPLANLKSKGRV